MIVSQNQYNYLKNQAAGFYPDGRPASKGDKQWAAEQLAKVTGIQQPTTPKPTTPTANTGGGSGSQAAPATNASVSGRAKREQERANFTGWDNISEVRQLQSRWWDIYVDTGLTNTAEQKSLNEQAQKIRQYNNPMYDPSKTPAGAVDWMGAEQIAPRDTTPAGNFLEGIFDGNLTGGNSSNLLAIGGVLVVGMVAMSFSGVDDMSIFDPVGDFLWGEWGIFSTKFWSDHRKNGFNNEYHVFMSLTLKMWQAAPSQLLSLMETKLSEGKITVTQYNAILRQRNKLYTDARLTAPSTSYKPVPPPPTIKDGLGNMVDDFKEAGKNVVGSVGETAGQAVTGAVNSAFNINPAYIMLLIMVMIGINVLNGFKSFFR